jgi:exodeoxyribonuclease-3
VSGPQPLRLLGVWTKPHASRERSYVGQLHAALDVYAPWLQGGPSVVAGDFNSNARWDTARRPAHARLVARLADCGLVSAYHAIYGEGHGAETRPTMHLLKQHLRPFHLDYVFVPGAWAGGIRSVSVGTPGAWLAYSDHAPVTVDLLL